MKFSILASGSTGNSIYIESKETRVLVDAGLSGKQIEEALGKIGVDPNTLDALIITHEHVDHIKGIGVLARRYKLPIYTNQATWNQLGSAVGKVEEEQVKYLEIGEIKALNDLHVEAFGISHDAAAPMGFCFYQDNKKLGIATDLGYVSQKIKGILQNADALIFEANHDVEMLRMCSYPWNVKRRILSDIGHLSNETSGEALVDIIGEKTKKVYLAHLSKDNNMMELARLTIKNTLEDYGISTEENLTIYDTYPDRPTKLEVV
ncbi:MBL fold metallo-hydrolase [Microaerobacter geothermalis]|uniref:MBL fold metallo-hydrolase n=1 Tax=Microaerobacter geothermalis TaxID=674972 RepID=UPI001F261F05|nr:MBL fold metallo-hydrolase [Microaerobacter geothermalis]MCF6094647.1 MBL fold metallo-hydrolase [Microaerobacter geothermalis]